MIGLGMWVWLYQRPCYAHLCFVNNDYSDCLTIFGTGFGRKKKGPSLAPRGKNFYKPQEDGHVVKISLFFQLSMIEKFECFDENSAEKKSNSKTRIGQKYSAMPNRENWGVV